MNELSLSPGGASDLVTNVRSPIIDVDFHGDSLRGLREHIRTLVKYRWLAAYCFGATFGLIALFLLITPKGFTSSTRMLVTRQSPIQLRLDGNVLQLADADSGNVRDNFNATQVAALQSRD